MSQGTRNRSAGHGLERAITNQLREIGFPHAVTCRSESRSRDNQKVDIMNKDEAKNGPLPYNVQCKNSVKLLKYDEVLKSMPEGTPINIIVHRKTIKKTTKFVKDDDYAILRWDDLRCLIADLVTLKKKKDALLSKDPDNSALYRDYLR